MKNGITENYNDKNKSENKIKLIVHILFIMFKHFSFYLNAFPHPRNDTLTGFFTLFNVNT